MDLDVLCPQCEDAVLEEKDGKRVCSECDFEMSLLDYQIYLAQRFAYVNNVINLPNARTRRSFGRKKITSSVKD